MESARREDGKKQRARFDDDSDLELLRQVVRTEPFRAEHGQVRGTWAAIGVTLTENADVEYTGRACQDRFKSLFSGYKAFLSDSKRASGVCEEHTERLDLLEDIRERMEDAESEKESAKSAKAAKKDRLEMAGELLMAAAETRACNNSQVEVDPDIF